MGVAAFFRWLSAKYPKIVVDVLESQDPSVKVSDPNPDPSFETDNLYIDMNGIIHPACHSESVVGRNSSITEEEMFQNITLYVDRLVLAVRPRKLLFLAIDGVAPRAKMNQQRARRFRSAQEIREEREMELECRRRVFEGEDVEIEDNAVSKFDRNTITPGTTFMSNLSIYLQKYIEKKNKKRV